MGVETELGTDFGHGQRVREIGFAGKPHLPGMGRCGISIGFAYERLFRFRGIGSQPAQDVLHRQGKMGGRSFNCTHGLVLWADGA